MEAALRLFKAVEIEEKKTKKASKELLQLTLSKRFVFSPEVVYNYSEKELIKIVGVVDKELGLTSEQANSSFHKSWKKIKTASIEQLVREQLIHYFTTYGFEALGIYDKDSVYIPNEKLEIPELKEGISVAVIKGYTKEELKEKLLSLLNSGIALGEKTMSDVMEIASHVKIKNKEVDEIKNKEIKVRLYDKLDIFPEDPIEFLRFCIYKATDKTLLIKDKATIAKIKELISPDIKIKKVASITKLFTKYKETHGLEKLSEIFYRFKPLFLAFKTDKKSRAIINKIRKLAVDHHKPMKEDYLNNVTAYIKDGTLIKYDRLIEELDNVNTFRKIRLAYALKYRTKKSDAILYQIRNGKGYATKFEFNKQVEANRALGIVLSSIVKDIRPNVKDKKIYIPNYINYALPATEKQFIGCFPSTSYVSVSSDMIAGVHWTNVKGNRIDIDLSMLNTVKFGWDANYRSEEGDLLFSGDMTDAPEPNGASELFYVKKQKPNSFLLIANYFNYNADVPVPLSVFIAKQQISKMSKNYTVDPNNTLCLAKTEIDKEQKILGLLVSTEEESRFYFLETNLGKAISSSNTEFMENSRKYLVNYCTNSIYLKEVLEMAGAKLVKDKERCDIDLSPEILEKDQIINIFTKGK